MLVCFFYPRMKSTASADLLPGCISHVSVINCSHQHRQLLGQPFGVSEQIVALKIHQQNHSLLCIRVDGLPSSSSIGSFVSGLCSRRGNYLQHQYYPESGYWPKDCTGGRVHQSMFWGEFILQVQSEFCKVVVSLFFGW